MTRAATAKATSVERLLEGVENKPIRPSRRAISLLKQARAKAEAAARQLADGKCTIAPAIEAASLLRAAEEAGADLTQTFEARREVAKLSSTVERVCMLARPKGR